MGIFEFDEEKYREVIREDAREDGLAEGIAAGLKFAIETCQDLGVSKTETINRITNNISIDKEEAYRYVEKYWKE